MTAHAWDPTAYLAHADERARPFVELVSRIGAADPRVVVDLGCGPGTLTALLAERWPQAEVVGLDASPEMIARARAGAGRVRYELADLRGWADGPAGEADVLVSNAALQWVPGHLALLPGLVRRVAPGGWFAFQVPGNGNAPTHTLRAELAAREPYAAWLGGIPEVSSHDPGTYLDALARLGCVVDAWETTYLHVLHGADPVFGWVSATGARPTLQALPDGLRQRFVDEFKALLNDAYPATAAGVVMPFRRVFVVARTPEGR